MLIASGGRVPTTILKIARRVEETLRERGQDPWRFGDRFRETA
jgi:hypothetical protein